MNRALCAWRQIVSLVSPLSIVPVVFVSLLAAGTSIGLLGASAWLIASAALMPPLYTLSLGITAVRAFGIGRAAFRYAERYLSHSLAFSGLTHIRLHLYDRAAALLPMRTGLMRQGEFLHDLLVGADALRDFFIRAILPPLAVGILTGIATVLLYVQIGYAAILLPLLFFIRLIIAWHVKTENEEARRAEDGAYRSALLDASAGADELACAGAAPAREHLFLPARDLVKKDEYAHLRETQTDALQSVFDAAVFILLLAALIPSIPAGTLTGIGLAVWFLVLQSLLAEYRTLPDAVRQAQQSAAAALHLLAPVEYEPSAAQAAQDDNMMKNETEEPSAAHALLTVRSLCFSYTPAQHLLKDLSFSVARGAHTAIYGTSGAGKTTLAQLLLGVWKPDSGQIMRDPGVEIAGLPQGSVLFSQSIRENFRRFRPCADEAAIFHALEIAQLLPVVETMACGIDTPIGEDGTFLSGGQRTRLLTALASAGEECLVLLDEPTLGLDAKTASRLTASLFRYAKECHKTLLVITHDESLRDSFKQTIHLA